MPRKAPLFWALLDHILTARLDLRTPSALMSSSMDPYPKGIVPRTCLDVTPERLRAVLDDPNVLPATATSHEVFRFYNERLHATANSRNTTEEFRQAVRHQLALAKFFIATPASGNPSSDVRRRKPPNLAWHVTHAGQFRQAARHQLALAKSQQSKSPGSANH
ncbi:hypothetical protein BDZ88DRAFT_455302 [Geranomyces variabilis]|nr:hypothetical protein BDZ88DRAFT_455302 [Geranomyces variabilis]KAJ3132571.1 hypothetical protein HDU90_006783 [Geranomyces variabilis]